MWRSLPLISSIRFSRSLNERAIALFSFFYFSLTPHLLVNRFARNFLERSHSRCHFDQAAAPQGNHSPLNRFLLQFNRRRTHQHQLLDLVIDFHHFIKTATSLISALVANSTAFALLDLGCLGFFRREPFLDQRFHRHLDGLRAFFANPPH